MVNINKVSEELTHDPGRGVTPADDFGGVQ